MTAREKRAVQFMPFDALKGYYDEILAQERIREPRREVGEDEAQAISETLLALEKGKRIRVRYYDTEAYVTREGIVAAVDLTFRFLIVGGTKVWFRDLYRLEVVN